jgi:hypothetical protein
VGLGARDHRHPAAIPKSKRQRDVAGRHYLTKPEINALYFATHKMRRPRGWRGAIPVGRYWRSALVLFFNYGFDTGTIWKSAPFHEPILWRHVFWRRQSPDRDLKENSRWGWLSNVPTAARRQSDQHDQRPQPEAKEAACSVHATCLDCNRHDGRRASATPATSASSADRKGRTL